MRLNGNAGWDSEMPVLTPNANADDAHPPRETDGPRPSAVNRVVAFFECPSCKSSESSTSKNFQFVDLDQKQKCFFCKKSAPVKHWRCRCNVVWHQCALHRSAWMHDQQRCSIKNPAPGQARSDDDHDGRKVRRIRPPTINDIINDDLKEYAKRKREYDGTEGETFDLGQTVHYSVKPYLLGPSLKKRFTGIQSL